MISQASLRMGPECLTDRVMRTVFPLDTGKALAQEHPPTSASPHRTLRPRRKRRGRRTLGCAKTARRQALVMGRFLKRDACGRPLCAGINTCETSSSVAACAP
jgi:hypothetical protein